MPPMAITRLVANTSRNKSRPRLGGGRDEGKRVGQAKALAKRKVSSIYCKAQLAERENVVCPLLCYYLL